MSRSKLSDLLCDETLVAYDFNQKRLDGASSKVFYPVLGKGCLSPHASSKQEEVNSWSGVPHFFTTPIINTKGPTVISLSIDLDKTIGSSLILFHNNKNRLKGRMQIALNTSEVTGGLIERGSLHVFIDGSDANFRYEIPRTGILCLTILLNPTVKNGSKIRINRKLVKSFTAKYYPANTKTYLTGPDRIPTGFTHPDFLRIASVGSADEEYIYLLEGWALKGFFCLLSEDFEAMNQQSKEDVNAAAVCVLGFNPNNGGAKDTIIYGKEIYKSIAPASITKMLTLITACHFIRNFDSLVTVVDSDITPGSGNNLKPGDIISITDLFKNTMLASSNTSANIIARFVGEYIQSTQPYVQGETPLKSFMREMNRSSFDSVGMQYSFFVNPHGLFHKEQVSCAYDLALLTNKCFYIKPISDIWGMDRASISIKGPNKREVSIESTVTPIVERNSLAIGGKTGTLGKSRSLAMLYSRDNNNLFSIVSINSNSLTERDEVHRKMVAEYVEN